MTTKDLADTFNTGDLKLILIKGIFKLKNMLGIESMLLIKVVVKVVRVFLTEALLARSFPSATRQRIAIVLTRPG